MPYQQLTCTVSANTVNWLTDWLSERGALAVTMQNDSSEAKFQLHPGETILWDNVSVSALFDNNDDILNKVCYELTQELKLSYELYELADQNWVELTQANFPIQHISNRLYIISPWHDRPNLGGSKLLTINPGLAFGTGDHPTTKLCLEWLASLNLKDQNVIDYGCGSGILALAALALGTKTAWAIDNDPQALEATRNNAKLNPEASSCKLHVLSDQNVTDISAPIVIANILAAPLIELAPKLTALVADDGVLVLSGMLTTDVRAVKAAYEANFSDVRIKQMGEWACLIMQ